MGNFNFGANPIQSGQTCVIVDSKYTTSQKFPKNVYGQGTVVSVIETKNMLSSRPGAEPVTISLVEFKGGRRDVYLTNSLKPV